MTHDFYCWLSWGQHAISQATAHFGSIIINGCNSVFQIFVIVLFLFFITVYFVIFHCDENNQAKPHSMLCGVDNDELQLQQT